MNLLASSFDASSDYVSSFEQQQKPWNDENYVPRMPSGKQKTPNHVVRNQLLQKHIDTTGCTQQSVIDALRVNSTPCQQQRFVSQVHESQDVQESNVSHAGRMVQYLLGWRSFFGSSGGTQEAKQGYRQQETQILEWWCRH
jgi:hypothetical protein